MSSMGSRWGAMATLCIDVLCCKRNIEFPHFLCFSNVLLGPVFTNVSSQQTGSNILDKAASSRRNGVIAEDEWMAILMQVSTSA